MQANIDSAWGIVDQTLSGYSCEDRYPSFPATCWIPACAGMTVQSTLESGSSVSSAVKAFKPDDGTPAGSRPQISPLSSQKTLTKIAVYEQTLTAQTLGSAA